MMKLFNTALLSSLLASFIIFSLSVSATEKLTGEDGLNQLLKKHQGNVIYLDFWASWCGPCRKSFPWLNTLQTRFKEDGFTVISVNLDANHALAEEFLLQHPVTFSVVYDPKGKTAKKYKVRGMPTSYLIDRKGNIVKGHTGFFTNKIPEYEEGIFQLIHDDS